MNFPEIHTERLLLKRLDISYKNEVYRYRSDKDISRYQSFRPKRVSEVESFIRNNTIEMNIEDAWFQLGIFYCDQIIGDFGLHFLGPNNSQCEIGYTIAKQFQRKGFAFEAVAGVIDFLFTDLNKHRLIASVDPENIASIRLLEKLGFRREAHFKKSVLIDDEWKDDVVFALLNEEWLKK